MRVHLKEAITDNITVIPLKPGAPQPIRRSDSSVDRTERHLCPVKVPEQLSIEGTEERVKLLPFKILCVAKSGASTHRAEDGSFVTVSKKIGIARSWRVKMLPVRQRSKKCGA